jgi:hypothetical protein
MKGKIYSLILDYEIRKGRVTYVDQSNSIEKNGLTWFRMEVCVL